MRCVRGKQALMPGIHRTGPKRTPSGVYIRITYGRGRGAKVLGNYRGASVEEALEAEARDAAQRAQRYADARAGVSDLSTLAGLFEAFEKSTQNRRLAESTKAERARVLRAMAKDKLPPSMKPLGTLPAAALASKGIALRLEAWRDRVAAERGPTTANIRVQFLRLVLNWAIKPGRDLAPANPAAGLAELTTTDRSALIWEPQHLAAYLGYIKREIDRIWREEPALVTETVNGRGYVKKHADGSPRLNRRRIAKIARLAAARDALLLACNTGMRRGDLACHSFAERQGPAIVYTARKGARRARSANKKRAPTVVPVLRTAALIYARRWEAGGASSPWVITSARGGPYTPGALGQLISDVAADAKVADRHLHDAKGAFVTEIDALGEFSDAEIARMVDWSEGDVSAIKARYVSGPAIANAMIARMRKRNS